MEADLTRLDELTEAIEGHNKTLVEFLPEAESLTRDSTAVGVAQQIFLLSDEALRLLSNLGSYANCRVSVDSTDEAALRLQGLLQGRRSRYGDALAPLEQFLDRVTDDVIEAYLEDATAATSRFGVTHRRKRRHELLSLEEERLVGALAEDGIHAWGRLYNQLSGTLRCRVNVGGTQRELGIAAASGLMLSPDDASREGAWRGSGRQSVHFLDGPAHTNRIERATLDTLMKVARETVPIAQRVARAQARAYGKSRIGPWDGRAPAPSQAESGIPFESAIDQIRDAYGSVRPEMGDFVAMMAERRWIEGTVSDHKRPGAYCTRFMKSKTPRVYSTYTGGMSDVITLAHELGHAFHGWVMRELPEAQQSYGMSLAETASTFGETAVRDALLASAADDHTRFHILWEDCAALPTFVLNIPTRFEFERNFYEQREERPRRPAEIKSLMADAWRR
ncbi:MAG: M3 family metallopeptidase, partial [Gammaproteobacteria bacterium]